MTSTRYSYDNGLMGKPPRLSRNNFLIWKNRIKAFFNGVDSTLLDIIKEGPFVPHTIILGTPRTETNSGTKE